jgi:hypothetical protein
MSDDRNTSIRVGPELATGGANGRIPSAELCDRDTTLVGDNGTCCAMGYEVEDVAVVNDRGLCGRGSCDSIRWLRSREYG